MEGIEPKKMAALHIWQILKKYSDAQHPLTQKQIAKHLEEDYGIVLERKAIGSAVQALDYAGYDIVRVKRKETYLGEREFEDSELRVLIDGVLSSRYITAGFSQALIEKICNLTSIYFRSSVKHVHSVSSWNKTVNSQVFYNIEIIDEAIESGHQIEYDYNKYGLDKKMHKTSHQCVSPYQMILHNQQYYLMAYSEYWKNMVFHRLDHITETRITKKPAVPLRSVKGYEYGIDYKKISSALPYMYTDTPVMIEFLADAGIVDQIIDWFGTDCSLSKTEDPTKVRVRVLASQDAMEHWAMQYGLHVEVLSPESFRDRVRRAMKTALEKYDS